jgi:hypothetical protein
MIRCRWFNRAGVFVVGNYANSVIQSSSYPINIDSNSNNKDGPFPAKSIIEDGDSVDNIMNFLYFNLFIGILLILVILLIYFYRYNKNIFLYIT